MRLDTGVPLELAHRPPLGDVFGWALAAELLTVTDQDRVVLTTRGRLLSNQIFARHGRAALYRRGGLFGRGFDHHRREGVVRGRPGIGRLVVEGGGQGAVECPHERGTDRVVVLVADTVAGVDSAQRLDERDDRVELVETRDHDLERLHHDPALGVHVGPREESSKGRVELEQALVEHHRGGIRHRFDGGPAGPDEVDLARGHAALLASRRG